MSIEKPRSAKTESVGEVPSEKADGSGIKIVKPLSERLSNVSRRKFLGMSGAAVGSAVLGGTAAEVTTRYVFGRENGYANERAYIEEQLREYEEARSQGVSEWFTTWKANFNRGIEKHGFDFIDAMGEFSEEGLRLRLLTIKSLSGMYSVANGVFFVTYAALLFAPLKQGIEKLLENKAAIAKDQKVEDFVNGLAARIASIEQRLIDLEQQSDVSKEEFSTVANEIEEVLVEVSESPLIEKTAGSEVDTGLANLDK